MDVDAYGLAVGVACVAGEGGALAAGGVGGEVEVWGGGGGFGGGEGGGGGGGGCWGEGEWGGGADRCVFEVPEFVVGVGDVDLQGFVEDVAEVRVAADVEDGGVVWQAVGVAEAVGGFGVGDGFVAPE